MTDEMTNELTTAVRDGGGTLAHYFIPNGQPLSDNTGMKKAIETDLRENYRVKLHHHKHKGVGQSMLCDCQILGTVDEI